MPIVTRKARCLLWLLIPLFVCGETQHSNQVQSRVYERLNTLMTLPVTTLEVFANFYNLSGFPHQLQALDRDFAVKYLYSMVLTSDILMPYYGLENGLLLGYWHSTATRNGTNVPVLIYREPGNSGYTGGSSSIYWETCVDSQTGEEETCQLANQENYISCIDDCALIPCPGGNNATTTNGTITLCQNYQIQQNERGVLVQGYVPTTYHCINDQGAFSQTPGEVVLRLQEDETAKGDCTFQSGALVNRTTTGPFAYCGGSLEPSCNTTYTGGYSSSNYDPRWRDWYVGARRNQAPRYSDPYVFFGKLDIGITYAHPIHESLEDGSLLFAGVLAVDMLLGDISNFLVDAYYHTEYSVAVYEDKEPYHMIGVSTGSPVVTYVIQKDNNAITECTREQVANQECAIVHLTIDNFRRNLEDEILYKAHMEFTERAVYEYDSPEHQVVSVKEDDQNVESTVYLATPSLYEQPGANLKWRVVITTPIERNPADTIRKGESLFILICILACLGFAICFGLFWLFFQRRNERAIQFADFQFTSGFILGCALMNLASLTVLGENTEQRCLLRMWAIHLLFAMTMSPLFMKAFRSWKLLATSIESAKKTSLEQHWSLASDASNSGGPGCYSDHLYVCGSSPAHRDT